MANLQFYLDEDAMDSDLVRAMRSRDMDVLTATEADLIRRKDKDHLAFATSHARVLYSFNVGDYHEIHADWLATGRTHAGIILAQQKRYSIGEQLRRLVHLAGSVSAEAMRNRLEFLSR